MIYDFIAHFDELARFFFSSNAFDCLNIYMSRNVPLKVKLMLRRCAELYNANNELVNSGTVSSFMNFNRNKFRFDMKDFLCTSLGATESLALAPSRQLEIKANNEFIFNLFMINYSQLGALLRHQKCCQALHYSVTFHFFFVTSKIKLPQPALEVGNYAD